MQKELANNSSIAGEISLNAANVLESIFPNVVGNQFGRELLLCKQRRVYTYDERFFVVTAIKNTYPSSLRQALCTTPKEIMVQVFTCWSLERIDLAALRIDTREYMLNRTVFAGRIHRLKNKQK